MAWANGFQVWLTEAQSLSNAQLVANRMIDLGWSRHAISAMCGNMRHESSVNPNMYEYGYDWSADRGFGLVQWTPRSKYWDWALQNGYSENELRDGEAQLDRIEYEMNNGIQWINTPNYPISFSEFSTSNQSLSYLTNAFCWNYERPNLQAGINSMPDRIAFAERCYNELDFSGDGGDNGNTIPDGHQLAEMPIDYIDISQGEYGSFTHYEGSNQELAIDFVFPMIQYPLFAPFDIECIRRDDNYATVVWKNTKPVVAVDGTIHEQLHIIVIHDDFWTDYNVGDTRAQGEHFGNSGNATGTGGISTGDHLHFEVMSGHTYSWPPTGQLHIYDVFDTSNVTEWHRDMDYPWKQWDGDTGNGSDPDPDPDPPDNPGIPGWDFDTFFSDLDEMIIDMLTTDVYKQGQSDFYKNNFIQLQKQMDNTYKVKPTFRVFDTIEDKIRDFFRDLLP